MKAEEPTTTKHGTFASQLQQLQRDISALKADHVRIKADQKRMAIDLRELAPVLRRIQAEKLDEDKASSCSG
jgi:hypothetical protein